MSTVRTHTFETSSHRGEWTEDVSVPGVLDVLNRLEEFLAAPTTKVITAGRNLTAVIETGLAGNYEPWVVKRFPAAGTAGRFGGARDGKAWKSWDATVFLAGHDVPVPVPIAVMESKARPHGSPTYFITRFLRDRRSFHDELIHIYRDGAECETLMALLDQVARNVRRMHDAGFLHNDLGNQNILIGPSGTQSVGAVAFIDLNRGRIRSTLSDKDRARDLSRITLPSDFLRVFFDMYWQAVPPWSFVRWEQRYRRAYAFHTATRKVRHPIREARIRKWRASTGAISYPSDKDLWVWDSRSGQPMAALRSKDRTRYYGIARAWIPIVASLVAFPRLWLAYRREINTAFSVRVTPAGRMGVALEAVGMEQEGQLECLAKVGSIPVLVRFYHHAGLGGIELGVQMVQRLRAAGHRVTLALVQDRTAALHPDQWRKFVKASLAKVADQIDQVEIAHAINRVKWGIWSFAEYERLARIAHDECCHYPGLKLMGPSTIDFEYPFMLGALSRIKSLRWYALSHHLYVDRRGAPEGMQAGFSLLEKCALAKAIARTSDSIDEGRVVVSEVNWPIRGTGVYSPVNSPYESPGIRHNDPSVEEDAYAAYMIRYLLIALCSGLVEEVYWWRLVARGYGLVDDSVQPWRNRPAYDALRQWVGAMDGAVFEPTMSKPSATTTGPCVYHFTRRNGDWLKICYSISDKPVMMALPPSTTSVTLLTGQPCSNWQGQGGVAVDGYPLYLAGPA